MANACIILFFKFTALKVGNDSGIPIAGVHPFTSIRSIANQSTLENEDTSCSF
jgi:hypothetical protein